MGAPMMPMGAAALGTRVQFSGDGGKLFGTQILYGSLPIFAVLVVGYIPIIIGTLLESAIGTGGILAILFGLVGAVIILVGMAIAPALYMNKFQEFYYGALTLDGQPCEYRGTLPALLKVQFLNGLLTAITFGIYAPWAMVKTKKFIHENVYVGGQPGRLSFEGDPASLLGKYILGLLLTYCTLGIYAPWFINELFAYMWENTRLDGRPYQFQKDPGGFFGTYLLAVILSSITCGIYAPWGICNILKWEAERVT